MADRLAYGKMADSAKSMLPSLREIENQLDRILRLAPFNKMEKPSKVLDLLVKAANNGSTLSEQDIRDAIFPPPYSPLGTHVRTAVNTVRGLLEKYYIEEDGKNDYVRISLPVSKKGYPVNFEYNRFQAQLKIATDLLRILSPRSVRGALDLFETILKDIPDHFHATIGRIECFCRLAIFANGNRPWKELAFEALEMAKQVAERNPDNWRAHHAVAMASLCNMEIKGAYDAFLRINQINLLEFSRSLWASIQIFVDWTPVESLQPLLSRAVQAVNDPLAWCLYGFCLYCNRDFEQAGKVFFIARDFEIGNWIPYLGLTFVCLALGQADDALLAYNHMNDLLADGKGLLPALGVVIANRAAGQISPESARVTVPVSVAEQVPKLLSMPDESKDWLQLGILMLDVAPATAITCLRLAYGSKQPLALLLPRWPLFDPLLEFDEFKRFVETVEASTE